LAFIAMRYPVIATDKPVSAVRGFGGISPQFRVNKNPTVA
jgi:hypothetical protein